MAEAKTDEQPDMTIIPDRKIIVTSWLWKDGTWVPRKKIEVLGKSKAMVRLWETFSDIM